jgi:Lrp/AsnC family transcriptional regulator, regulator for asnA, asnC and gidA
MIEDIDKQIVRALCRNARISNIKLAQQLGVASSTIARRIETLLQENVITIRAIPNPFMIGYRTSVVIGLDIDLTQVDNICAILKENSQISLIVTTFGRYDVMLIVDYPDYELLIDFIHKELSQIAGIKAVEPFFVSEIVKRYAGMFHNHATFNTSIPIDDIDKQLIKKLGNDGRIPFSKLADELNISGATITRRVASLVNNDFIKITAIPNPAKFGYPSMAGIILHTNLTLIDRVAAKLAASQEVHTTLKCINGFQIFCIVHFPNPETLYIYLKENISRIEGINNIEICPFAEVVKLSTTSTGLDLN